MTSPSTASHLRIAAATAAVRSNHEQLASDALYAFGAEKRLDVALELMAVGRIRKGAERVRFAKTVGRRSPLCKLAARELLLT
jgi:hypothetical protein